MHAGDIAWVLVSASLVWLMTPGLALFYGGIGERKNWQQTLLVIMTLVSVAMLSWFAIGYSLAFSGEGLVIGNLNHLGFNNVALTQSTRGLTIPDSAFALFQGMFPIITIAIITGAVIGRMRTKALFIFLGLWVTFVYPLLAHLVWGDGWLAQLGASDFAGGTVVHISSGVTGLVLACVIGKRRGPQTDAPQSQAVLLGGALLWVGWFGFNAGSALAANQTAVLAFVTTGLAAAGGAATWLLYDHITGRGASLVGLVSGALSGLVVITPAAGFVAPWSAVIMGLISGVVGAVSVTRLKHFFGYDDTLDAFGIHGVIGTVGALLTGVFADSRVGDVAGAVNGNWQLIGKQLLAVAVTVTITVVASMILLMITRLFVPSLRVSPVVEATGDQA